MLNCEQYGKKEYEKEHQHSSLFNVLRQLLYNLNVTDTLIIPFIFIFLSCREKAHNNKEFRRENSKPHHGSRITTR